MNRKGTFIPVKSGTFTPVVTPSAGAIFERLKQQGLDCINLTPIFRGRNETLWVDVCHVNSLGYRIVLDKLCKRIIERATPPDHGDK